MKQRQAGLLLLFAVAASSLVVAAGCGNKGASGPPKTQAQIQAGAMDRASAMKAQGARQQQQSGAPGANPYAPRGIPMGGAR